MPDTPSLGVEFEVDADGYIIAPKGDDLGLPSDVEDEARKVRIVELPSGNSTRLEIPGLACLLWAGDSKLKLAKAIWRHEQDFANFENLLDSSELDFIYEWALVEFAKRRDSLNLASVCKLFHVMPSAYIGIRDRMTAYLFDTTLAGTLADEEARQYKKMERTADKRVMQGNLPPDPIGG